MPCTASVIKIPDVQFLSEQCTGFDKIIALLNIYYQPNPPVQLSMRTSAWVFWKCQHYCDVMFRQPIRISSKN